MSVIATRKYTDRIVMAADSINLFGQTKETKNLRVKLKKIGEDFRSCWNVKRDRTVL